MFCAPAAGGGASAAAAAAVLLLLLLPSLCPAAAAAAAFGAPAAAAAALPVPLQLVVLPFFVSLMLLLPSMCPCPWGRGRAAAGPCIVLQRGIVRTGSLGRDVAFAAPLFKHRVCGVYISNHKAPLFLVHHDPKVIRL